MTDFLKKTYKIMEIQGKAIIATLESTTLQQPEALLNRQQIILTGCGDSYAVANFGRWIFLNIGIPSVCISPTEIEQIPINSDFTIIGVTASGRSRTTVKALRHAQEREAYTIALTDNPNGEIHELAHELWLTESGVTTYDIVPTAPTTTAMGYLLKIAEILGNDESISKDCKHLSKVMENAIQWAKKWGEEFSEKLIPDGTLYLISEGPNFVAADLGMMKFNEYAVMKSQTVLREEFRHHGNLPTKDNDTVMLITDSPMTDADERYIQVISETLRLNATILCTPSYLDIRTRFAQTILNTIALQYAAYHNVLKYHPEMEWFRLPNAKAFRIY
ncbi:MAG: SIS domain-containing protein [Candidatus Lokiarchaeota archaeon]|nr:SIS domain-containing protein [Candidatus Lokiarchaeota archaeon]